MRLIFRRAAEGQTPNYITQRINHMGWRTKRWVARRSGRARGGGRWTARLVTALLRTPVYCGGFADGKGTRAGSHPAIVTDEVFGAAQAALDRRRTGRTAHRQRHQFPLRSKIVCPKCGRRLGTSMINRGSVPHGPRPSLPSDSVGAASLRVWPVHRSPILISQARASVGR